MVHRISHQPGWLASDNTGQEVISAHRSSPANRASPVHAIRSLAERRLETIFDDSKPRDNHSVHRDKSRNKYRRWHCVVYTSCKPHKKPSILVGSTIAKAKAADIASSRRLVSWAQRNKWRAKKNRGRGGYKVLTNQAYSMPKNMLLFKLKSISLSLKLSWYCHHRKRVNL